MLVFSSNNNGGIWDQEGTAKDGRKQTRAVTYKVQTRYTEISKDNFLTLIQIFMPLLGELLSSSPKSREKYFLLFFIFSLHFSL